MQPELTAQQCSELQELMIEHTLATATSRQLCSVELWHTDKPNSFINNCAKKFDVTLIQQDGGNLGERMLHALSVTLKNADSALIVGSDCPPLTSSHLLRALQALHEHKTSVVLIPAKDGGYVLIGMRTVESELFQNIDWSSNKVLQQTRNKIQLQQLSCLELESLWDLDRPIDLQRLKELGNTKFWEPFL